MRLKALAEIYTMHSFAPFLESFAPFSNLPNFSLQVAEIFADFCQKFRKFSLLLAKFRLHSSNFLKKCDFRAVQRSALCRSRRELSNAYLLAKFGLDTAENEPSKKFRAEAQHL